MLNEISRLENEHRVYCQSMNESHTKQIADEQSQHANQIDFIRKSFEDQIKELDYQHLIKEQQLTEKNVINVL
jgi:hypothetical protein